MKCFKRPFRRKSRDVHKFSKGLRCSKEDKWALKIIFFLGASQQDVPTIMSKKIEKKSMRIVSTQLTRSQNLQVWDGFPVSGFWPWIWTWDALPRSLFHACSYRTQKNTRLNMWQELKNHIGSDPTFLSKVITGDESWCYGYDPETKQASSQWKTPTSPDRKTQDKWGQMWIRNSYFRCSRNRAPGIRSSWTDWQSEILLSGDWERKCEVNAQNCGDRVIGFSNMTTPKLTQLCLWSVIWPLWDRPLFPTHPIHRT